MRGSRASTGLWSALVAAFSVPVFLAGCNEGGSGPESGAGERQIALIMGGPPSDDGWYMLGKESLDAVSEALNARGRALVPPGKSIAPMVANLVREGSAVVVAYGNEYRRELDELTVRFPKVHFVQIGSSSAGPANYTGVEIHLNEAAYLAGIVAARVSEKGKVGAIAGSKFEAVDLAIEAFFAGARSVRPEIQTQAVYVGSWDDVAKAKADALALIDGGADVIFQNTNAAARGVFEACVERGVWAIGSNRNQNELPRFSDRILGTVVIDMRGVFRRAIEPVLSGGQVLGKLDARLDNGLVDFAASRAGEAAIDDQTREAVARARKAIASGELKLAEGS